MHVGFHVLENFWENEIYQTNTLYRLSALSSFCVSSEAGNNYMHWTTGFFSNLPSVLAKEAPSFSAELVLIQVWSTHTHTPVSIGRFLPWKMGNRKWLNKLLIREFWKVFKLNPQSILKSGRLDDVLRLYWSNGKRHPQTLRYTSPGRSLSIWSWVIWRPLCCELDQSRWAWVVYFCQKKYATAGGFIFFALKASKLTTTLNGFQAHHRKTYLQ